MGGQGEGTAAGAGPSAARYLPATVLAAGIAAALILIPDLSSWTRPWSYGLFLRSAGPPAPSRLAVVVTLDDEESARVDTKGVEAEYLAHLAATLQSLEPSALALELPAAAPADFLSGSSARSPVVLAGDFTGFAAADPSGDRSPAGSAADLPPLIARSLYPHLEGSGGLNLARGEALGLPGSLSLRTATGAFAGPLGSARPAFSFPAFARLERGTVAGLGVEAARRVLGVPASAVTYVEGVGVLFDPDHILPVDAGGNMFLRFHEAGGLPVIPAARILDGTVRPEEIKGKAVVVAAKGRPPVRTVAGNLSPAEIWATSLSNLLEKAAVSSPAWGGILAVAMGLAFAGILLAVHFADIGFLGTLLMGLILAAVYPLLSLLLFVKSSWWLPPELPALLVIATWLPFGITRLVSPRRRPAASAPPIKPAPVYDPLVAMGGGPGRGPQAVAAAVMPPVPPRPTAPQPLVQAQAAQAPAPIPAARPTPARGIPLTPGPAFPQPGLSPQAGAIIPPAALDPARPRPAPVRGERQGPIPPATASAPAQTPQPKPAMPLAQPAPAPAENHLDPRDPPLAAGAEGAPRAPVAVPRPSVQAAGPAAPSHAHSGSISDEIERDSKGGLVRVGKYRIVRKMGFGSGGDVFEGFDTHMDRRVAIKTITKEAASHFDRAAERFVVEAKAAGSLNHPCINTIYDFGTIRDVSYMVLEYLDGSTLSQWMRTHPIPTPRQAAPWVQQICSALDYAHSQKVIHRDLKPANLMVVHNGATIKLLDFGIAKLEDVGLTQTGMTVGTPSYMSPEQLTGSKVTAASDQYGLAVVLYQLFTYKLPYQGTKIPELCNRILKNDLIPITEANPALGPSIWEALRKAMSKAPEDRYPNCMALCQALEAAAAPAPQPATPV